MFYDCRQMYEGLTYTYTCAESYMLLIPVSFPGPMQVIVWNAARLPSHTNHNPSPADVQPCKATKIANVIRQPLYVVAL